MKRLLMIVGLMAVMAVDATASTSRTHRGASLQDTVGIAATTDTVDTVRRVATPQRTVTPIENRDNLTAKPTLHYYDKHGRPLDEPVAVWVEEDTVKVSRAPKVPLFNGVTVGFNFFDAILRLAGQSYGSYNLSGSVDLHNWFFPTLELGLGMANNHVKDKNFRYKTPASFFGRIGTDYNFLYNSNPAYKALLGLRLGYSSFRYDITDVSISNDYWGPGADHVELPRQKASAFWGEVSAGLQVKIYKGFGMGWSLRYKFRLHVSDGSNSSPWFLPGFGARNAPFSATFSIFYTFGNRYVAPDACDNCPD